MLELTKRKIQEQEGLTLVEVLAAIGVLSITLLAILTIFRFNYISSEDTLRQTVATNLAREGIESMREVADPEENAPGDLKVTFDKVQYTVEIDVNPIANNMYQIVSRVTWNNPFGGQRSVVFQLQRN